MAENDSELLSTVYREISERLGMNAAMTIYEMFKGQQISFPRPCRSCGGFLCLLGEFTMSSEIDRTCMDCADRQKMDKNKDNGILLEKMGVLNLSKEVMLMAENDFTLLNAVYTENIEPENLSKKERKVFSHIRLDIDKSFSDYEAAVTYGKKGAAKRHGCKSSKGGQRDPIGGLHNQDPTTNNTKNKTQTPESSTQNQTPPQPLQPF